MIVQRKEEIRQEEIERTFEQADSAESQVQLVRDLREEVNETHEQITGLVGILEEGANAARREKGVVQQARVRAMLESFKASKDIGLERLYVLLNAANGFVDQAEEARNEAKEIYETAMDQQQQFNEGI